MQRLIEEIKACRDEQYGFAALALALIIPNVCASFCKKGQSKSADYIAWCNDWVKYPENLDGKVVYSLRCAFLHAMDGNLEVHPKFDDYKSQKVQSGENRKLSYRFFFPHEDAKDIVINKEENDTEVSRTICSGLLVSSIIDAYERFAANTPEFSHDYINLWFEG